MSRIVSFEDYTPPARFDSIPWSEVRIEQSDTAILSSSSIWTQIDVLALSPLDVDPGNPAVRDFTTALASDTPNLWYRVTFADSFGSTTLTSTPVQNSELMTTPYATTSDLFRVLKVKTPTAEQTEAAQGDLDTATIEINAEIDQAADAAPLSPEQLELCKGVCIDRAADLWRHRESAPGILGVVDEAVPSTFGRYSWARYAARLSPLKDRWGIA